ncbi:hypothetical protein D9M70_468370 [compost metagenome]
MQFLADRDQYLRALALEQKIELARDRLGLFGIEPHAPRTAPDHVIEQPILEFGPVAKRQQLAGTLIGHHHAAVAIQHEQAMRHIVERRVELAGNRRDLARRQNILIEKGAHIVGHHPGGKDERQDEQGKRQHEHVLQRHQADHDRQACGRGQEKHGPLRAVVAPNERDHRGQRHRYGRKL